MTGLNEFHAALVEAGRVPRPTYMGWAVPIRRSRPPTPEDISAATSLVLGVDAVLSHTGAAAFWGLDPFGGQEPVPECSVPMGRVRGNVLVHQRRRFGELDIVCVGSIAVTSVMQTLADLGAVVDADVVERAAESAIRLEHVSDAQLRAKLEAFDPTWFRTGMVALRTVMRRRPTGAPPTGSDAETVCLQHYRAEPLLPEPVRQFRIMQDGVLIAIGDLGFPPVPFFTEVDGLGTHGTEEALAYDLHRQNRASDAAFDFRRFTAVDVYRRPMYVRRETVTGLRMARLTWRPRLRTAT